MSLIDALGHYTSLLERIAAMRKKRVRRGIVTAKDDAFVTIDGMRVASSRGSNLKVGDDAYMLEVSGDSSKPSYLAFAAEEDNSTHVYSITGRHGSRILTTEIVNYAEAYSMVRPLPEGMWSVNVQAHGMMKRATVDNTYMYFGVEVDGNLSAGTFYYDALSGSGYLPVNMARAQTIIVPPGTTYNLPLRVVYKGNGTAGTTYAYGISISGVAIRVR